VDKQERRSFWWVESPDRICVPTTGAKSSGKACWRHKVNDPGYVRYSATSDRPYSQNSWQVSRSSDAAVSSADFIEPADEDFDRFFRDNLTTVKGDSSEERSIIASLSVFQSAHLAYDEPSLKQIVSNNFKQTEEFQGSLLLEYNRSQAFDFSKTAVKHRKIEFNLKSITLNVPKGMATAMLVASYHGKYFTTRYLEAFSFTYDGGIGLLQRQARTRIQAINPNIHDVTVYLLAGVSKDAIADAFSSTDVDAKFDKIFESAHERVSPSGQQSVLFVFREAPRFGSIVRTHIPGAGAIIDDEYQVTSIDPYFVIEQDIFWGRSVRRANMAVYVDGHLAGFRSITD
jgi:hypothetical protein